MASGGVLGGLLALRRLLAALARGVSLHAAQLDFYAMLYGLASRRVVFINKGIWPVDPAMPRLPALAHEPCQAAECFEVLRAGEAALGRPPRHVAEAACGRGGALLLAAAMWPEARLAGFDLQPAAIARAAALLAPGRGGDALAVAGGSTMPLADGWADLLISIEGMMSHDRMGFLVEARRVLAPDGMLAVASTMNRPVEEARLSLLDSAAETGLDLVEFQDITPAVLEACRRDGPRRLGILRFAPGPLGRLLADAATLPGSPHHEELASGRRCFYLAVFAPRP